MSCISIGETAPCASLEITQGELRAIGWQLKNQDGTPVLVAGYGARLHIRERMNSPVALLELSNGAGLRLVDGICWFEPTLAQVNGLPTGNIRQDWVYDLFLEQPTASPIMVAQGKAIVYPRVTRWQAPEPSSISPDPVLIEAIVAGLQGPKGDKGDAGSGGMDAATYDPQNIAADAFHRANHRGTQLMASISDKQGKVLDDLIVIEDYFAEIDSLMTDHGYIVKVDVGTNGLMSGATILVASEGGVITQTMLAPLTAKFGIRYYTGSWSDWQYGISTVDASSWFSSTTAEAANAVVTDNPNQVFLRSVSSDEFKTGIEPMLDEYADAIVQGAQPIYYRSTCDADPEDWSYWGISAEQLATIDHRLVHWGHDTKEVPQPLGLPPKTVPDLDSPLKPVGVQYSRIVPALLNVLKRQGDAIAALEARVSALEGGAA